MNHDCLRLVAHADLLLMVADLLRAPDSESFEFAAEPADVESLAQAAQLADGQVLWSEITGALEARQQVKLQDLASEYRRLFDGATVCGINEASYVRRDKGAILGDVCAFYRAFGWQVAPNSGERPDHLLAELEFVAMLLVMLSQAGDPEQRDVTQAALTEFTHQHPNDWIIVFCQQLRQATVLDYFVRVANLLENLWVRLVAAHNWPVDPPRGPIPGIIHEGEDPYECGAPDLVSLSPASISSGRRTINES